MKNLILMLLILGMEGCSYHNMSDLSIKEPSRNNAKSTFFLAYMVNPPYRYSDSARIQEMPILWFDDYQIIVLDIRVIDVFISNSSSDPMWDSLSTKFHQHMLKKEGISKEQYIKRGSEICKSQTVYLAVKRKRNERMLTSLYEEKRTFLLRNDYSSRGTDSTFFTNYLYMPQKKYFNKYLINYKTSLKTMLQ